MSTFVVSRKQIQISESTYKKLAKLGKYNDTMDNIINRLLQRPEK